MSVATVWLVGYLGWIGSEIYIAISTRTRHSSGNVKDRGTMRLLWLTFGAALTAGIWTGQVWGSNLPGGALWLAPVSLGVLLGGIALRWVAVISLGKAFSANVAIAESQTVRKTGLYRWLRHPSYTGLMLCLLAVALHTRNWISMLLVVVPSFAAMLYRIAVEEQVLREHFGEEYVEYSRHTRRLIPGIY